MAREATDAELADIRERCKSTTGVTASWDDPPSQSIPDMLKAAREVFDKAPPRPVDVLIVNSDQYQELRKECQPAPKSTLPGAIGLRSEFSGIEVEVIDEPGEATRRAVELTMWHGKKVGLLVPGGVKTLEVPE